MNRNDSSSSIIANYDTVISLASGDVTLGDALQMSRIPWAAIREAGADLYVIAGEARVRGDERLYRLATRANR